MIDVEKLRSDMEAGTDGPWRELHDTYQNGYEVYQEGVGRNWVTSGTKLLRIFPTREFGRDRADARRIARLPDLEQAYMDLHERERKLHDYAVDVTRSLTELTVGGSEFFMGKGHFDFHRADISRCEENIRWRADCRERLGFSKGKKQAEAERDALQAENRKLREALSGIAIYGSDTLSGRVDGPADTQWYLDGIAELVEQARAALAEGDKG